MSLERTLIIECINFHITSPTLVVLLAFSLGIEITIVNKYNSLFNHIQGCYNLQRHAFREGSVSHRTLIPLNK